MLILSHASPARGRCDTSGLQEAGKICPVTPEQEWREYRDDRRKLPSGVVNEDVVEILSHREYLVGLHPIANDQLMA